MSGQVAPARFAVFFRYRQEVQGGERPLEYGLIAEEVAEVFPELVVYDEEGEPFTVKYHLLSSMLLNELKKLRGQFERTCSGSRPRGPPRHPLQRACLLHAAALTDADRDHLRRQARLWVESDLMVWLEVLDAGEREAARDALVIFLHEPDLASLRDPEALATLPETERRAWQELWAEVRATLAAIR